MIDQEFVNYLMKMMLLEAFDRTDAKNNNGNISDDLFIKINDISLSLAIIN